MTSNKLKNRRTVFALVHPKFQKEFILLTLFIAISSTAITLLGAWFLISNFKLMSVEIGQLLGSDFEQALSERTQLTWMLILVSCLINFAVVVLMSLMFSNRVSGALVRLTRELNNYADGSPTNTLQPREKDFFPELISAANRVLAKSQRDSR